MAIEVRVKMLRDVGGFEKGDYRTLTAADAERLSARGVVQVVGKPAHSKPRPAKKRKGAKPVKNKAITTLANKSR